MKEKIEYRYEFANGDVVELRISRSGSGSDDKNGITSEWLELLLDLDRREYNNEHAETRRHCSLDAFNQPAWSEPRRSQQLMELPATTA